MKRDFRVLLQGNRVHAFDGGMGTMLYNKGVFINRCYDELTLKDPELVKSIHKEYVKVGCEILETNSFGATWPRLKPYGLEGQCYQINKRAAEIAREVAGEDVYVAGSVGPLGIRIEPYGPTAFDEAKDFFKEAIKGLVAGGVDAIILETFSYLPEIEQGIKAAREVCDLPVIAQMTIQENGRTTYGDEPVHIAAFLDKCGADIIGLNCSVGPAIILSAMEKMVKATARPLSAQPNAGLPREIEGRKMYMANPEYMAEYAKQLILVGVKFLGGCCGTTPEHIRKIVDAVRSMSPRHERTVVTVIDNTKPQKVEPIPAAERSQFAAKVVKGQFVTSIEIVPPQGCDPDKIMASAQKIKDGGVDAINVPDGPRAQSRMGAIATSLIIEQRIGIESVVHYTCRDRNLLGMQSDLLGAAALGLRNLLLVTGDPPKMGPYPLATAVFDIDSIGLTNMVYALNHGVDIGGNSIGKPTAFFIGVGANPGALELDYELKRFDYKVEAGAQFAITQPVFDANQLFKFLKAIEKWHIPVLAGIWPLVSYRNAEFLANEVPGVVMPREILERMKKAATPEAARKEGMAIACEMAALVKNAVQGIQVSAPLGKVELALEVIAACKH